MRPIWMGTLAILSLAACSKDSATSGLSSFPALAAAVDKAAPAGLKTARGKLFLLPSDLGRLDGSRIDADGVKTAVQAMFRGSYGKLSGGQGTGYINSYLEDLDSRFTEIKNRFTSNPPGCLSKTAQTYEVDLSAIETSLASTLKLSMDVQCLDIFSTGGSNVAAEGSGLLFGKSGDNYSMMLTLNQTGGANTGFGYAAKATNKGAADETIDLLFGEANQNTNTRNTVARLKAKPTAKTFELVAASSSISGLNPISGGSPQLGCGFRVISDGNYINVMGTYVPSGNDCTVGPETFDECYDASFTHVADSFCTTLATSYTIGSAATLGNLDRTDLVGKNDAIYTAMQINTEAVKAKTTSVSAR